MHSYVVDETILGEGALVSQVFLPVEDLAKLLGHECESFFIGGSEGGPDLVFLYELFCAESGSCDEVVFVHSLNSVLVVGDVHIVDIILINLSTF